MTTLTWVVNDVANAHTRAEHGFACWIETAQGSVLFDTGSSGELLLDNLSRLELDPANIDALVISHAHDDHTGGLPALLPTLRAGTPLYAHPTLFRSRYSFRNQQYRSRGIPLDRQTLAARLDLRLSAEPQEVLPGVWTTGEITPRPEPEGRSAHHFIREGERYARDPYQDDLSIVLQTGEGIWLLCGCCHAGLLNTLYHVQRTWPGPSVGIVGGTHLTNATQETIQKTRDFIVNMPALRHVWLGHCSGDEFMQTMARALPAERYRAGQAGDRLVL